MHRHPKTPQATQNVSRKFSGDKNIKVRGWGKIYLFVSKENKRIKPIKQSNYYADVVV